MKLTFNKRTALAIMRFLRSGQGRPQLRLPSSRSDMLAPDPSPQRRWTRKYLNGAIPDFIMHLGIPKLDIVVPRGSARIRTEGVACTTYDSGIPDNAFIDLGCGIAISGPELLFAELADTMHPLEHLMLGHELCGTFSRDACNPYNGSIAYEVRPATSTEKIGRFLANARRIRGIEEARSALRRLNDNAWSPTESLVAALLRLPMDSLGFDMGPLVLNPRIDSLRELPGAKASRVPDIVFAGTSIGLNYDGLAHLDLDSIVKAAIDVGVYPGSAQTGAILDGAVHDVREKVLDDIRRNRELAADGLSVFPILKEDLYVPGGIEQIVAQLADMLEKQCNRDMRAQRRILAGKALAKARHRMMLSFLPGRHERNVQIERFIQGNPVCSDPLTVHECWIEF